MENQTKSQCRCEKSSCGCAAVNAERCTCGERCACKKVCACAGNCGCAAAR